MDCENDTLIETEASSEQLFGELALNINASEVRCSFYNQVISCRRSLNTLY